MAVIRAIAHLNYWSPNYNKKCQGSEVKFLWWETVDYSAFL